MMLYSCADMATVGVRGISVWSYGPSACPCGQHICVASVWYCGQYVLMPHIWSCGQCFLWSVFVLVVSMCSCVQCLSGLLCVVLSLCMWIQQWIKSILHRWKMRMRTCTAASMTSLPMIWHRSDSRSSHHSVINCYLVWMSVEFVGTHRSLQFRISLL